MGYAILIAMTRFIRRTISVTVIETLTLIWVNTTYDERAMPNDASAANLAAQSDFVTCSVSRVTTSVHSTLLPAERTVTLNEIGNDSGGLPAT